MTKPWLLDGQVDVCDTSDFRPILVHLSGDEADTLMPGLDANSDFELLNLCGINPGDPQNLDVFNLSLMFGIQHKARVSSLGMHYVLLH